MKSNANPRNTLLTILKRLQVLDFDEYLAAYDFGEYQNKHNLNYQFRTLGSKNQIKKLRP